MVEMEQSYLERVEVCRVVLVDVEDLLGVPDHPVEVAGEHDVGRARGEDLPEALAVLVQLLPLALDLRRGVLVAVHLAKDLDRG